MSDDRVLLGQKEQVVLDYYQNRGFTPLVKYTANPRADKTELANAEKRVVRIQQNNEMLEILVAYFQAPCILKS